MSQIRGHAGKTATLPRYFREQLEDAASASFAQAVRNAFPAEEELPAHLIELASRLNRRD